MASPLHPEIQKALGFAESVEIRRLNAENDELRAKVVRLRNVLMKCADDYDTMSLHNTAKALRQLAQIEEPTESE